jgi:membrane protease YdiL (CAAX protease family)
MMGAGPGRAAWIGSLAVRAAQGGKMETATSTHLDSPPPAPADAPPVVDRRALAWFLGLSVGVAWPLFLLPFAFGAPGTPARQVGTLVAWGMAMWAPGLAALIVTRLIARRPLSTLHLRRLGPRRVYLVAWLLPPALAAVAGLLTWLLGAGRLDLEFTLIRQALAQSPGSEAVSPGLVVLIQVATALLIAPLINTPFALGEELGWRGFLLPQLLPLGRWRAIVLSNVVWGLWHAPAVAQGLNYPGHPVLGIGLMVVFCLLIGAIFSWLYFQTTSPWAPALAHGSLNATAGLPMLLLTGVDITIGGTTASLIGWIGMAAVGGWLVATRRLAASV